MSGSVSSFIRATELWLPNADGTLLDFAGGLYGPQSRMARVSANMCFGRGEGLPGRAWDDGVPVVLHELSGSYFRRTEAALADGLTCGIALPIFVGDQVQAVMVFFCGDDEAHAGAIEVWHNDPRTSKDLTLADGHYGRTSDTFEFISRRTSFRAGTGLPGLAWQQRAPVFWPDLGRGGGFLRADSAVKVGINRGLALPCATRGPDHHVLAFLSALGTPIAPRLEIWRPDAAGRALLLQTGFCESNGLLGGGSVRVEPGQGFLGRCWQQLKPQLSTDLAAEPGSAAGVAGLSRAAVLPVLNQGQFVAAVALSS